MIIDLKKIFVNEGSSMPLSYALDLSEVEYMGSHPLKEPVKINGSIENKASLIRFNAEISYDFCAPCDRCGVDTVKHHTVAVEKSLASSIEGDDSDTILLVPDMKLDLDEFLYSEVIMSLPMKHVCSEMCRGICFKCGKNLNEGDCGCEKKEIDPRLAVLADLLK